MIKKYNKYLITALILFCIPILSVFAREVTINDLGEQIDAYEKKYKEDIDSYYIIGNYVFTSHYKLNTRDIMLASRSIVLDNDYDGTNLNTVLPKMTIHEVERKFDEKFNPIGWKILKNYVGETELKEDTKINIKYIDYEYLKDLYTVTLNAEGSDDYQKSITVEEGDKIDKSLITGKNAPKKDGYQFKEWVKDDETQTPWNFDDDKVTGNITLKATWYEEVNTDTLLEKAEEAMVKNEYYGVKFDKENSKLIFTVYDKNEKNSLISGTGITGNIVSLLQNKNVVSIKFGSATITKDDLNSGSGNPAGPEGEIWKKFGEALKELTGKDFQEVTLGDLIGKDLKLEISVDEENARTHKGNKSETYNIEFVYNAGATLNTEIPEKEKKDLLEKFNYTPESTYQITGENGAYKVEGYVTENEDVNGFGNNPSHYYFAYTIKLDDGVDPTKVNVKIPKGPNPEDGYNTANGTDFKNNQLTVLMEVEEGEGTKYRDIIVDIDGVPTKIRIDFTDLKLEKSSKFSVQSVDEVKKAEETLGKDYGWKKETGFDVKLKTEGTTVKVSGLLPILETFEENKNPFGKDDTTGYYLPFVIKTDAGKKSDNTGVTVQFIHDGEDSKTFTADNFDGDDVLYILRHLDKDAADKTFKIVVDMDGEGTGYAPYEMTFDWSELKLQERSTAKLKLDAASEEDKNQLTGWGYNSSYNDLDFDKESNSVKLTGTMKEQVISSDAFGEGNENGYYFDFTFEIPDGVDRSKVKIARLNNSTLSDSAKKDFETSEWTNDGKLTILFRFPEDPKCEEKDGNCKLYYKVDFDGDGNEYLPTLYEIDYSGVTFKKSSLVNIDPVASGTINGDEWKGFEENENYEVQFDKNSSTFKVTGLITIFDDDWTDSENPFKDAYEYYLAFKLSKAEVDGEDTDTIVKFLTDGDGHGDENKIAKDDFNKNNSIYVLKYLNPNKEYDNKKFTITVDFDDDGEEYEPYTITIDWSELDFQYKTKVADTTIVNPSATSSDTDRGYISDQNRKDVEKYGYDFANVGNITIDDEGLEGYKLTGTIKEQDVENGGFEETTGYYVPVKIYGPTIPDANGNHYLSQADGRKKWTVFLHDEKGNYREITPSQDDYNNGYIVVLFKLKDDDNKKITYKIDWDGSKGNVFLEQEVTISYGDLTKQALNTITYNYKDAEGNDQTESTKVYQNEEATLKDIKNLNTDYRTFDGWYKSDNNKVETETLTISDDKDETLTAHWTLDADAFIKAVMEDLNKNYGTVDDSEKFKLTMDEANNTITIDVEDSRVLLSEMNDTNIPGAIAYILQKGEIKGITLSTGDKKVVFTKDGANNEVVSKVSLDAEGSELKNKIKDGARALFQDVLSDAESTMTLSKMALDKKSFTLEIGDSDENVTLVDDDNKTYTFNFETEAITVTNESELEKALQNEKISHIYLGADFDVQKQYDVNRSVTINGGKKDTEGSYKITVKKDSKDSVESIFKVSASGVTIDNIELSDTKEAIVVDGDGANLTTTGLKLTKIDKAGINVKKGNLNAKEVTFESETHDIPTVLVEDANKKNAKVDIDSATKNDPKYINVKLHRDKKWCKDEDNYGKDDDTIMASCKSKSWDDEYTLTNDTYYYLKSSNIKNYKFVSFMGAGDSMWANRLYEEGQTIGSFKTYYGTEKITIDGAEYYFVGYGKVRRTTNDFKTGTYYSEILTDIAKEIAGTRGWHFANFAQREDSKKIKVAGNTIDGVSEEKIYYTYKFKDNEEKGGMTIGQLKAIDEDFAEMWSKLNEKAQAEKKAVTYEDSEEKTATDDTVIDKEITLKIGNPSVVMQP